MEDLVFQSEWSIQLLEHISNNCSEETGRTILQCCADYHYQQMNMEALLKEYVGRVEDFIQFISAKWGWIVDYDKEQGIITADENKSYCLCPIVKNQQGKPVPKVLCHCSEGFAKKMFSKVAECNVEAEVIKSVLYGDETCIYRIKLLDKLSQNIE